MPSPRIPLYLLAIFLILVYAVILSLKNTLQTNIIDIKISVSKQLEFGSFSGISVALVSDLHLRNSFTAIENWQQLIYSITIHQPIMSYLQVITLQTSMTYPQSERYRRSSQILSQLQKNLMHLFQATMKLGRTGEVGSTLLRHTVYRLQKTRPLFYRTTSPSV